MPLQIEGADQQGQHHDAGHQRTGRQTTAQSTGSQQRQRQQRAAAPARCAPARRWPAAPRPQPEGQRPRRGEGQPVAEQRHQQERQTRQIEPFPSVHAASRGRPNRPQTSASRPIGSSARKASCQPATSSSSPPNEGPRAVPQAERVPSSPMPRCARAGDTSWPTMASDSTIMQAAPAPAAPGRQAASRWSRPARRAGWPAQTVPCPRAAGGASRTCPQPARHHRQTGEPQQIGPQHPLQTGEGNGKVRAQCRQQHAGHAPASMGNRVARPSASRPRLRAAGGKT